MVVLILLLGAESEEDIQTLTARLADALNFTNKKDFVAGLKQPSMFLSQ